MDIDFKNDLQDKIMKLTIKVKRKTVNKPRVTVQWPEVENIVSEQYTPPSGFDLGKCLDSYKMIDNTEDLKCKQTWRFELISKKKKTTRKKTVKKTPTSKKWKNIFHTPS